MSSPIIFKHRYTIDSDPQDKSKTGSSSSSNQSSSNSKSLLKSQQDNSIASSLPTHPFHHHRRKSSFVTPSSPYARRKSFLSKSMLENDNFQTYELSSYDYPTYMTSSTTTTSVLSSSSGIAYSSSSLRTRIPSFSINLTQSQGFIWNQDLFASSYQQARAGLNPDEFQEGSRGIEVVDIIVDDDDVGADVGVNAEDDKRPEFGHRQEPKHASENEQDDCMIDDYEGSDHDDIFHTDY